MGASAPGQQGGCWQHGPSREVEQLECSSCLASSSLPTRHVGAACKVVALLETAFSPLALCCFIPSCIMQRDVDNPVIITEGFKTF